MFLRKFITTSVLFCSLFVATLALAAADPVKHNGANDVNFTCALTITKPQDWHKQNVIINLLNFNNKQVLARFDLAAADPAKNIKAVTSVTKIFNCGMYPKTQLQAHYFPIIWSTNKGKKYLSKEIFQLSSEIKEAKKNKAKNLKIEVVFPKDFVNVPVQVEI